MFADIYDNLQQKKANTNNEMGTFDQGYYTCRSFGWHYTRYGGGVCSYKNAIVPDMDTWSTVINVASLKQAQKVVHYSLSQKWASMPPSFDEINDSTNDGYLIKQYSDQEIPVTQ